jgi:hypothetical protein
MNWFTEIIIVFLKIIAYTSSHTGNRWLGAEMTQLTMHRGDKIKVNITHNEYDADIVAAIQGREGAIVSIEECGFRPADWLYHVSLPDSNIKNIDLGEGDLELI